MRLIPLALPLCLFAWQANAAPVELTGIYTTSVTAIAGSTVDTGFDVQSGTDAFADADAGADTDDFAASTAAGGGGQLDITSLISSSSAFTFSQASSQFSGTFLATSQPLRLSVDFGGDAPVGDSNAQLFVTVAGSNGTLINYSADLGDPAASFDAFTLPEGTLGTLSVLLTGTSFGLGGDGSVEAFTSAFADFELTPVPLPAGLLLLPAGLALLAGVGRRAASVTRL